MAFSFKFMARRRLLQSLWWTIVYVYLGSRLFPFQERAHRRWKWDDSRDVCRLWGGVLQDQIAAMSLLIIEDHQ